MCFGCYHSNRSNSSGENRVSELHAKPACSQYVVLDCAPAPGATVNRDSLRRNAVQIEPPARNQIHAFTKHPNRVKGVSRRDVHSVARVEILLAHLFERSGLFCPGRQRLRDRGQCGVLYDMLRRSNSHVNSGTRPNFSSLLVREGVACEQCPGAPWRTTATQLGCSVRTARRT